MDPTTRTAITVGTDTASVFLKRKFIDKTTPGMDKLAVFASVDALNHFYLNAMVLQAFDKSMARASVKGFNPTEMKEMSHLMIEGLLLGGLWYGANAYAFKEPLFTCITDAVVAKMSEKGVSMILDK